MPTATASRSTTAKVLKSKSADPVDQLRRAVRLEGERRQVLREFVSSQLEKNIDYGQIMVAGRTTKPTLFKPGMEKVFSLLEIVSCLERDEETLSMIEVPNVVAYKCRLYRGDLFLSEGRGACTISEKLRVNDAIKIAEKRARMDACLNLGFSEYFTQDLEDWDKDVTFSSSYPKRTALQPVEEEFMVVSRLEKTARSGNPYAELQTDRGIIIAFRATQHLFEEGKRYRATGGWEERSGRRAFIITAAASEVVVL